MTHLVIDSPIGRLDLVARSGALTGIGFDAVGGPGTGSAEGEDAAVLVEASRQLAAYFAGALRVFDLPLSPQGTDFQRRVWHHLASIPWGTTTTYGAVAAALGMPSGAARAVGAANGANPIPIVLPCHRVIGADGTLTGYAGGLDRKATLLRLEGVLTEADRLRLF